MGKDVDLFPGYLLAEEVADPRNVSSALPVGELTEVESLGAPGRCRCCSAELRVMDRYPGPVTVSSLRQEAPGSVRERRPLSHRYVCIEYTNRSASGT